MGFSRLEYWSGLPFPSPGDLPNPGIQPRSPALAGGFLTVQATREALRSNFRGEFSEDRCEEETEEVPHGDGSIRKTETTSLFNSLATLLSPCQIHKTNATLLSAKCSPLGESYSLEPPPSPAPQDTLQAAEDSKRRSAPPGAQGRSRSTAEFPKQIPRKPFSCDSWKSVSCVCQFLEAD